MKINTIDHRKLKKMHYLSFDVLSDFHNYDFFIDGDKEHILFIVPNYYDFLKYIPNMYIYPKSVDKFKKIYKKYFYDIDDYEIKLDLWETIIPIAESSFDTHKIFVLFDSELEKMKWKLKYFN